MKGKNFILGCVALGLACIPNTTKSPVEVPQGQMGYSSGETIKSFGFMQCSAVILDNGNKAVMAHALPKDFMRIGEPVRSDNLMVYAKKMLYENNIDIKSTEAIVSAGSKKDLEIIVKDLKDSGIKIRKVQLDEPRKTGYRNVIYNPTTDKLDISYFQEGCYSACFPDTFSKSKKSR